MKSKNKMLGAGIGLAAVAAAGTFLLTGKRGAKNRERVAEWAIQFNREVNDKVKDLKDLNQQAYNQLVDETAERYARVKRVGASEMAHISTEVKNAWSHIGKQLMSSR